MAMRKVKPKSRERLMEGPSSDNNKKIFPRFHIELAHLPEAKKWKIGNEYTVKLKLKMIGISISKFQNDSEYDIIGIDPNASSK